MTKPGEVIYSTTHKLDDELRIDRQERMKDLAKNILSRADLEINNRNKWIKDREMQKIEIEEVRRKVYEAYDAADEQALEALSSELTIALEKKVSQSVQKKRFYGQQFGRSMRPRYNESPHWDDNEF